MTLRMRRFEFLDLQERETTHCYLADTAVSQEDESPSGGHYDRLSLNYASLLSQESGQPPRVSQVISNRLDKEAREYICSTYHEVEFGRTLLPINQVNLEKSTPSVTKISISWKKGSMLLNNLSSKLDHGLPSSFVGASLSISFSPCHEQNELIARINEASRHEQIFAVLDQARCFDIVKQLRYLHGFTIDDPKDLPMDLKSLKHLAIFFISDGITLPDPAIGISPYELLQAEWHCSQSSAVMKFLANGNILYAGVLEDGDNPKTIQDTATPQIALAGLRPYICLPETV